MEKQDSGLSEVESLRTEIRDKFQSLRHALLRRENYLNCKLDEIESTIETALKQWNGSVTDAKHTLENTFPGKQKNTWRSKLGRDVIKELTFLEENKPNFEVSFQLSEGIEEVIAKVGTLNMKQTTKQVYERPEIESLHISDQNLFEMMHTGKVPNEHMKEQMCLSRKLIGEAVTGKYECIKPLTEILDEAAVPVEAKKSVSITDKPGTLGDSYVVIQRIMKPIQEAEIAELTKQDEVLKIPDKSRTGGFMWRKGHRKNQNRIAHKLQRARTLSVYSDDRSTSFSEATYKLKEVKICNYLAERVTVDLRKHKVSGTLRCIVDESAKVPIVGIELDTEDGDCDGYFGTTRYFKTKPNKACFVSADCVCITISM